jgi:hypothetical protein
LIVTQGNTQSKTIRYRETYAGTQKTEALLKKKSSENGISD